jgi:hypothetical protein
MGVPSLIVIFEGLDTNVEWLVALNELNPAIPLFFKTTLT